MAGGAGPVAVGEIPEVDVPTAKELIEQIHEHMSVAALAAIVSELEAKVAAMRTSLEPPVPGAAGLRQALEWTFVGRRRGSAVLGIRSDAELSSWVSGLFDSSAPLAARFDRFCAAAGPLAGGQAAELASELLHFTAPDRHWLWSRWMWSNESRTGALPLLIGDDFELDGGSLGETYERVGRAYAMLDDSPEASAFRPAGGGSLGTDLLLACTYAVYMRTVLGLKMTQEFNALVPAMPQLVRRLLGVHFKALQEVR
ncbi:hypothetical protein [Conexibacter sp. S30A1]|jgi:hypothetical protein|uniref:hypothetical protein n=1 Tax=Conexibacter sp. S30A1 TaxID=2937800 RepID=UPI00200EDF16|nr:hypothetical protein [Conexibacter sp. S30A1]